MDDTPLRIGNYELASRLIVGTGKYPSLDVMQRAHAASGTSMVTIAIRRINLDDPTGKTMLDYVDRAKYQILPNTAGCTTAKDAILTAQLARELLGTDLIKLEVIGDPETLYPDTAETIVAARELVRDGFTVLPYIVDDPTACKRLEDVGCAAVMPLGAPIGSGLGICNPYSIAIIKERSSVPVIVDAGVGTASDAAIAMEIGVDAVLMNTGIAAARDPVAMARAMRLAVEAGRIAYRAGRMEKRLYASKYPPPGSRRCEMRARNSSCSTSAKTSNCAWRTSRARRTCRWDRCRSAWPRFRARRMSW
jgi:thiazole synthase